MTREEFQKTLGIKDMDKHDNKAIHYASMYANDKTMTPIKIVNELFKDAELSEIERMWITYKLGEFNMTGVMDINGTIIRL